MVELINEKTSAVSDMAGRCDGSRGPYRRYFLDVCGEWVFIGIHALWRGFFA